MDSFVGSMFERGAISGMPLETVVLSLLLAFAIGHVIGWIYTWIYDNYFICINTKFYC